MPRKLRIEYPGAIDGGRPEKCPLVALFIEFRTGFWAPRIELHWVAVRCWTEAFSASNTVRPSRVS